jgi:hypothetical protein
LYRLIAKIASPNSGIFPNPLRRAIPSSSARPGPAQPQLSPANRPSLQVAAWRMIAAAGKADFC